MKDVFGQFSGLKTFGLGYDTILKQIEQAKDLVDASFKGVPGYPPFNVRKTDDNHYVIELAVAGFGTNSLDIETKDNVLSITGKIEVNSETEANNYIWKGIADRAFKRTFALADTMEIKNAELVNGMLKVYLENMIPIAKQARKININEASSEETKPENWFTKALA